MDPLERVFAAVTVVGVVGFVIALGCLFLL